MASEHVSLFIFVAIMMAYPVAVGKESACNTGDLGSISGLGRSPDEGNDYPLQYFCLENSMGKGAWQATVQSMGSQRVRHV